MKTPNVDRQIAKRRHGESQLPNSRRVLQLFAKHMPAAVAMFDLEMRYLLASDRWITDHRLAEKNLVGRSHYEVFPEISEHRKAIHKRCLAGAVERGEDEPFPRADGTLDWIRWEIHPWHDSVGAIGGIIIFSEVVTERKRQEEEIHRAKEEAEQASMAKDRFLTLLSHGLRTPLNPVMLAVNAWTDDETLPPQLRRDLESIRQNVEIEVRLIENLLDLTAITRGKIKLDFQNTDLHELLLYITEVVGSEAADQKVRLTTHLDAARHVVSSDFGRLAQVVCNLVSNAVKFTPTGGAVTISTADEGNKIAISITDTGVGIPPEFLPHVFDPFEQGPPDIARRFGGMGLGLTVTKGIIELLGGAISVQSEGAGKGATVSIVLETLDEPK